MGRSSSPVVITTTSQIQGRSVTAYLGIVSTHVVAGTGLFSDWAASFSDVFGGRSSSYARQLEAINGEALDQLRQRAAALGADAVIGVSIDHDEVSGGSKSMLMVTVAGTAVKLSTEERVVSGAGVTGQAVEDRAWLIYLLKQMVERKVPSDSDMKRIVASRDPAFAPLLLKIASLPQEERPANIFAKSPAQGVIDAYFSRLEQEEAKDIIYKSMTDPETSDFALSQLASVIVDQSLVSLRHTQEALERGSLRGRVHLLTTLRHPQDSYSAEDLQRLDDLATMLPDAYPDVATDLEKRGMIGTKSVWECGYCGEENHSANGFCMRCDRTRRGLRKNEHSPESVVEALLLFRAALAHEMGA